MDLLQDIIDPEGLLGRGLLPEGYNLENIDPEESSAGNMSHELRLPLFSGKTLVDHNMNNSRIKLPRMKSEEISCTVDHGNISDTEVMSPRCKTPLEESHLENLLLMSGIKPKIGPITPSKPDLNIQIADGSDPWTPTSNLRMLIDAASPEIRNRERQQELNKHFKEMNKDCEDKPKGKGKKRSRVTKEECDNLVIDETDCTEVECESEASQSSRKEKSLGLLCQRFLKKFPKFPDVHDSIEISLDEVAKELGVERRRIYDIVNVLESVEIVSRLAKNRYLWHGKTNLKYTLAKLLALAKQEKFSEQIDCMKEFELSREVECDDVSSSQCSNKSDEDSDKDTNNKDDKTEMEKLKEINMKKDKSLGIMSQRFIMLFLVCQPKTVNLDLSAKVLIGDPNVDKTENAKFKTKIRRLYDIANILTSLDLIQKVHVTEVRGRKPAFQYIGPDLDDVGSLSSCSHDGAHRPSSRHSLLDCIQNPQVCSMLAAHKSVASTISHTQSSHSKSARANSLVRKSFPRHSSLDQICEVAELERNRLLSQPSSPSKDSPMTSVSTQTKSTPKPAVVKKVSVVKCEPTTSMLPSPKVEATKADPDSNMILMPSGAASQTMTLSEQQLKDILKNFANKVTKTATGISIQTDSHHVDATTQSSPELINGLLSIVNRNAMKTESVQTPKRNVRIIKVCQVPSSETSAMVSPGYAIKRPVNHIIVGATVEKRPKLEELVAQPMAALSHMKANGEQKFHPIRLIQNVQTSLPGKSPGAMTITRPVMNLVHPLQTLTQSMPVVHKLVNQVQHLPMRVPAFVPVSSPPTTLVQPNSTSQPDMKFTTSMIHSQSQPNTPTFHLSNHSSPVMFIPARPASADAPPHLIDTPPTAVLGSKPTATKAAVLPGFSTLVSPLTAGTPTHGQIMTSHMSPLTANPLLKHGQHVIMPNTIAPSPLTNLHVSSHNIFKPKGGFPPSSNNIINLVPLFSSSQPGKHSAMEVSPIQMTSTFAMNAAQIMKIPVSSVSTQSVSPNSAFLTPTNTITVNGKSVSTPGCFFRSTPGGLQQVPTMNVVHTDGKNSAFQVVNRYTINNNEGVLSTARRLQLSQDEHIM